MRELVGSSLREDLFEEAESVIGETRFTGLAVGDLTFQIGLEFRKGPVELFAGAYHLACFPDASDRLFEDVDCCDGHDRSIPTTAIRSARDFRNKNDLSAFVLYKPIAG